MDKKSAYTAGIISCTVALIFLMIAFEIGIANIGGKVIFVFAALFGILGTGSFLKPDSMGQVAKDIMESLFGRKDN